MSFIATTHETASPPLAHDEERWAAVVRRDRRADRVCPTFYTWRFEQGFASHDAHGGRCVP